MKKSSVLLVDDENEFVTTLAERLTLRGIAVRTAISGEEALRMIEAEQPQAVVLDVRMPDISGLVVLQQIKSRYPDVQVLLLSAHCSTRDGIEGMRLGALDYLIKPVNIDELILKLSNL
ncbi:MAG: response regulator [Deltaproteobacteria bacterium]|nr:response regulator [Deltaproteobacteria bacterium]